MLLKNNPMKLQVLVSTMNQTDYSLIQKMNIHSDAIVINQGSDLSSDTIVLSGHSIEWFNFPERGIGKSRNTALIRADHDICLLADDDVTYCENYEKLIVDEFERNPRADLIIFNIESTNPLRPEYMNLKNKRIRFYNCLRYGTFRVAIRLDSIRKKRIYFSLLFGGGSQYGSGEDSLFLVDCLKKGLQIYASTIKIGTVTHKDSSWFSGYTEKYFYDKGALFCSISDAFAYPLCLQYCIRHRETVQNLSFKKAYCFMVKGVKDFKICSKRIQRCR